MIMKFMVLTMAIITVQTPIDYFLPAAREPLTGIIFAQISQHGDSQKYCLMRRDFESVVRDAVLMKDYCKSRLINVLLG